MPVCNQRDGLALVGRLLGPHQRLDSRAAVFAEPIQRRSPHAGAIRDRVRNRVTEKQPASDPWIENCSKSHLEGKTVNRHIVQILTRGLMVATVIGSLSGPAIAQVDPNRPGSPAPADARDDRPNWGLLGLLGLAGLAGLTRRGDRKDYRADRTTTASRP
jgi:hypothetical protein